MYNMKRPAVDKKNIHEYFNHPHPPPGKREVMPAGRYIEGAQISCCNLLKEL